MILPCCPSPEPTLAQCHSMQYTGWDRHRHSHRQRHELQIYTCHLMRLNRLRQTYQTRTETHRQTRHRDSVRHRHKNIHIYHIQTLTVTDTDTDTDTETNPFAHVTDSKNRQPAVCTRPEDMWLFVLEARHTRPIHSCPQSLHKTTFFENQKSVLFEYGPAKPLLRLVYLRWFVEQNRLCMQGRKGQIQSPSSLQSEWLEKWG